MPKTSTLTEQDKSLLISLAEPRARRIASKKAGISSGSLPVLAGLVLRHNLGLSTRPRILYAAGVANEKLIRCYLKELRLAGLLHLERLRGCRYVRPTLTGLSVAAHYTREMRATARAFTIS